MSDLFKIKSNAKVPANFIGSKVHGPLTDKEGNITKSVSDENRLMYGLVDLQGNKSTTTGLFFSNDELEPLN